MSDNLIDVHTGELANIIGQPRYDKADYMARCYVQGTKRGKQRDGTWRIGLAVGNFDARFHQHPWVREALSEGWDRDLREHLIREIRFRLLKGGFLKDMVIEDLMPSKEWVVAWREQARRAREAKEWQDSVVAQHGSMDAYLNKTVSRRAQAHSVSGAAEKVIASLSERSRAMSGEGAQ